MRDVIVKVTAEGAILEHGYAKPGPDAKGDMVYVVTDVPDGVTSGEIVRRFGTAGAGFGRFEISYGELSGAS